MSDTPDYRTDVAYLRTFSSDLSPVTLRLVAALNGFSPPPARDFAYAELGAGNGDTIAALAAAHPEGRFLGVDFNPEHVAFGSGLCARGELDNLRFVERDFEDLARDDHPSFDFLTAHGVMSWVSPEKRRALARVASATLKPGGLLYVSYNAQPGWAAVEPLRRLLLDATKEGDVPTLERARRGLGLAKLLRDAGAEYFRSNPAAGAMVDTMLKMGLPYVVHEYLQPHWHPLHFADVAGEMANHDLHFIGQIPLHLNYRDLSLPPPLLDLFKGVSDRLAFESLKDTALNEFFRRDVYIKGRSPRADETTRDYLSETPFGTLVEGAKIRREIRLPHYTLRFAGPIFDALIPALAEGAATVNELASRPALAGFDGRTIRESLLHLALGEQIVPMLHSAAPAAGGESARHRLTLPYNRMIIQQRLADRNPIILASPTAGTGVVIPMLEAVCIRLLTDVDPGRRSAWIRDFVTRQPLRLQVEGAQVEGAPAQAQILEGELARFQQARLPKLTELGVLSPHL